MGRTPPARTTARLDAQRAARTQSLDQGDELGRLEAETDHCCLAGLHRIE
jgi:hypothetical protein